MSWVNDSTQLDVTVLLGGDGSASVGIPWLGTLTASAYQMLDPTTTELVARLQRSEDVVTNYLNLEAILGE